MKSLQEKYTQADQIVQETKVMLKLQREYFDHGRTKKALNASISQEKKVKELIKKYDGVQETLGKGW